MKKLIPAFILILASVALFAQDSTGTGTTTAGFPSWVYTAAAIILAVYEIVIRFFPTAKNYSIVGFIIAIIQKIVPNNSSNGAKLP